MKFLGVKTEHSIHEKLNGKKTNEKSDGNNQPIHKDERKDLRKNKAETRKVE